MTHKGWKEKELLKVKDKVVTRARMYKLDASTLKLEIWTGFLVITATDSCAVFY